MGAGTITVGNTIDDRAMSGEINLAFRGIRDAAGTTPDRVLRATLELRRAIRHATATGGITIVATIGGALASLG